MIEGLYFVIGLILTVFIIPLVKKISINIGYLYTPEGDPLKIHALPTPHSGGVAILGVLCLLLLFLSIGGDLEEGGLKIAALLFALAPSTDSCSRHYSVI